MRGDAARGRAAAVRAQAPRPQASLSVRGRAAGPRQLSSRQGGQDASARPAHSLRLPVPTAPGPREPSHMGPGLLQQRTP